jgi:hypothetical protein
MKENGIAANSDFLEVFNFKLISGNASDLDDLNTILLSSDLAEKLFPGKDPVNQELIFKKDQVLVVKGVFKNCPDNSSLQFDFLVPYEAEVDFTTDWHQLSDATFIKLLPSADPDKVHALMRQVWSTHVPYEQFDIGMISVADLRYGADFEFFNAEHGHGDTDKLYLFIGVAVLILILACLNYLILASSNAMKKEKSTWIRKVHGASSGNIITQSIFESVLLSILSWGAAALISEAGLRYFENLVGITISPVYFYTCVAIGLGASILIIGLAAGFYPAVQAGSHVLAGSKTKKRAAILFQRNMRQTFVGSQFILSIALVITGLVIFRQAAFMKNFHSGYASQNIVEYSLPSKSDSMYSATRDWLNGLPEIDRFSFANSSPVNLTVLNTQQNYTWEGLGADEHMSVFQILVDEDYLNVFNIPIIRGRFFSPLDENMKRIVINEKLATMISQDDPVGKTIRRGENNYEIIGVVRNFNFQHLSNEIRPLLFLCNRSQRRLYVNVNSNSENAIITIREKLSGMYDQPVQASFISEKREMLYIGENQILTAILFFTIMCIVLSSLGLVGLVSHSAAEKTREIAVRKVFGADSGSIMISQNRHIFKMFLPGMAIGCALAWFIVKKWLENYAYRNEIELWIFILGPALILLLALLSVGFQTWKTSRQAPAISLKYQ